MFNTQTTAPDAVLSTIAGWRTPDGDRRPVLCISNGRSRIFVDPSDFPAVARKMAEILDAQQAEEVGS